MASYKDIENKANELLRPIIEKAGYEIVEIKYYRNYKINILEIFIYKKEGISLNDCILINDLVDPILETNDLTEGKSYSLNISSPGLDRPIVTMDDYRRNLNVTVEALYLNEDGKEKTVIGELMNYDVETVTIKINTQESKILKSTIVKMLPYVDMKKIK